jgi:hypothetical protein
MKFINTNAENSPSNFFSSLIWLNNLLSYTLDTLPQETWTSCRITLNILIADFPFQSSWVAVRIFVEPVLCYPRLYSSELTRKYEEAIRLKIIDLRIEVYQKKVLYIKRLNVLKLQSHYSVYIFSFRSQCDISISIFVMYYLSSYLQNLFSPCHKIYIYFFLPLSWLRA